MNNLLLLDIGFLNTGCVVLQLPGQVLFTECIETKKSDKKQKVLVANDDFRRCQEVARRILEIATLWGVRGIIVELPHGGGQGARPGRCMAMATGIAAAVVEALELPVECVTPAEVKAVVRSKGAVTKLEVQEKVRSSFPDCTEGLDNEHICDALAAFLAARTGNMVRLMEATQ